MPQEVVLLHSALGLRPAVHGWAAHLRAAGHRVHTPDIFDGEVFASVEEGLRKRDALGIPEIGRRTRAAVATLPAGLVFMGWSLGAVGAQVLAATRPGAKAAVLLHGIAPLPAIGVRQWPTGVPIQIHSADADPWVPEPLVQAFEAAVTTAGVHAETWRYPGAAHMFDDPDLPGHSVEATALARERITRFLERLSP